ncbi:hypothetical protein C1H46_037379 [Malus baccata]|uniref:Peptidase C1A papain C-terminal domain-containing protein n=1 Tax=Malus baccata TaxID=106549 RepID=A0A540KS95_MALBA|nr:hypothetical protein C1H46_037379 [Malus baccata]
MAFERNILIVAILITLGTLASQATSRTLYEASIAAKHEQWMEKFGRVYQDSAEKERHHTGYKKPTESTSSADASFTYKNLSLTDVPPSIDWREQDAVTSVKDQGNCGGDMAKAFAYIQQNGGIASEENYPYQGSDGTCDMNLANEAAAKITNYARVTPNSETDLLKAVSMQPVSVAIVASQAFQLYSGGLFTDDNCGTELNHAVTIIGYGTTEDATPYWLIKNSWSGRWGENGYMKILRNADAPEGVCGLAMQASYPII